MEFGGSGIVEDLYNWICATIPAGRSILELGSGPVSTKYLSRRYRMVSVEHDLRYVGAYPGVEYVFAPVATDGWYDARVLRESLSALRVRGERYDLILVDGPVGSEARRGMLDNFDLFDLSVPMVIDDVEREWERKIAEEVSRRTGRLVQWRTQYAII